MTTGQTAAARRISYQLLIPRLQRLGIISPRVEPRYREIGLIE